MFREFLGGRSDGLFQCLKVNVVQYRGVHYRGFGCRVTRCSRHFAASDKDIIMLRRHGLVTQLAKRSGQHSKELVKHLLVMRRRRYITHHHVSLIRIDASSSTLSLYDTYPVLGTIGLVHLLFAHLMATVDNRWGDHPREERRLLYPLCQVMLYLQVLVQQQPLCVSINYHHTGSVNSTPRQNRRLISRSSPK